MIKLLFVDNKNGDSSIIKHSFDAAGFICLDAHNQKEGLSVFKKELPDAVFIEKNLPDGDGLELLKQIKTLQPQKIVVLLSTPKDANLTKAACALEALDVISKPFNVDKIIALITQNIHLARKKTTAMQVPTILIADDEESNCHYLKKLLLKKINATITTCNDGNTALKLLTEHSFDIALLDITMPGINGISVLEKIKNTQHGTKIIIISAWNSSEVAAKAIEAGAVDYLIKPLEEDALLSRIKIILVEKDKFIPVRNK